MVRMYKTIDERKVSIPFSIAVKLISEIETEAGKIETNKSELVNALIKYYVENKKNQEFINKIKTYIYKI